MVQRLLILITIFTIAFIAKSDNIKILANIDKKIDIANKNTDDINKRLSNIYKGLSEIDETINKPQGYVFYDLSIDIDNKAKLILETGYKVNRHFNIYMQHEISDFSSNVLGIRGTFGGERI